MTTLFLVEKRKFYSDQTSEAFLVLPEPSDEPSSIFQVTTTSLTDIADTRSSAEVDVGVGGFHLVPYTASNSMYVKSAPISDNNAKAVAFAIVSAVGEDGLKLNVVGAFKEELKGAFFWG